MAKEAKDAKKVAKDEVVPTHKGPLSVVPKFEQELERFFGDHWPRMFEMPFYRSNIDASAPKVDVVDRNGEVCVRAELPGFNKDEIDVSVNDSTATIKAAHKTEEEDKAEDFYRREISRSYMSRTVSLPVAVDGSRAKASFSNGVLELTVPKTEKSKSQKIEIEG